MADDCLFCGIVAGSIPSETIDSDERTVAFMDINPATPGHALVVPRAHSADLMEIGDADLTAVILASQRLAKRMKNVLGADGINLINACGAAAWQTVFHFHIHVVPRYVDDPLKLPWIPEPGDSDEIAATAARLRGDNG
jgi:histidine triad (HIT) family protein